MTVIFWIWRGVKWGSGAIALAAVGFASLAFISAAFPTPGRAQLPADRPQVYICTGLTHSDFAVPVAVARSQILGPVSDHIPATLPEDIYVMMGWGDHRFFTEVHTLSQLRPGIALSALAGRHDTALRIQLITEASLQDDCRALPLDRQGQAAIARHIRETIAAPPTVLPESTFGLTYLQANQSYSPFHTCNDWASDGLRKAGLPTARWIAPFAFSVTWPLRSVPDEWDEQERSATVTNRVTD